MSWAKNDSRRENERASQKEDRVIEKTRSDEQKNDTFSNDRKYSQQRTRGGNVNEIV